MLTQFLIFQIAALTGASGQALYKVSADRRRNQSESSILSPLIIGVFVYILTLILFSVAFSYGGRIGPLYASYSTTFIWSMIIGKFAWNELFSKVKFVGIILIVLGVCCVALH